jgi:hypothetical protein
VPQAVIYETYVGRGGGDRTQIPTLRRFGSELTLFIWGLLAFPRQGAFLGHIHTPELRLRIVWVNLLMIPRDYSSCTFSRTRICDSMNLAMSARIFVGGLGAVTPETAAFFDTECRSCAVCESFKALVCKVLR